MSNGGILRIMGGALAAVATILYLDWRVKKPRAKKPSMPPLATPAAQKTEALAQPQTIKSAKEDVEHIFNDEFREELRNRGRLHFEKIIGENAMFLQQDLRLTTSQLNEFMKQEITRTLKEEFSKYEKSIIDAKQIAVESIEKTQSAIEQQRQA